jgi:ceramide glucosyltransferase
MLHSAIEILLAVLSLSGLAYYLIALASAYSFHREGKHIALLDFSPPVSILKPLKGAAPDTYEALRGHCLQDYIQYEILFGVNDGNDPAIPIVNRLISEFPNIPIRLIVCSEVLGANRKVSNLVHLLREARHDLILVNDGDILVSPAYLRRVMSKFEHPEIGMVTCLYRGRAARTLGSRLEAQGIATDFAPGVLTARKMEGGLRFGLGSTLAMTRAALDKIGGFAAVVDYLADDYQLGERIAASGFKVCLSDEVVETSIPPYSFSQFWQHQLRWARTMRVSRPGGYFGTVLTFALPWSILLVIAAPQRWWAWSLLVIALIVRLLLARTVGARILEDRNMTRNLWLLPVRDLLGLAIWIWSYADNEVHWRGETFRLRKGKMLPIRRGTEIDTTDVEASDAQRR